MSADLPIRALLPRILEHRLSGVLVVQVPGGERRIRIADGGLVDPTDMMRLKESALHRQGRFAPLSVGGARGHRRHIEALIAEVQAELEDLFNSGETLVPDADDGLDSAVEDPPETSTPPPLDIGPPLGSGPEERAFRVLVRELLARASEEEERLDLIGAEGTLERALALRDEPTVRRRLAQLKIRLATGPRDARFLHGQSLLEVLGDEHPDLREARLLLAALAQSA